MKHKGVPQKTTRRTSTTMPLRLGLATLGLVVGILGLWASQTEIAGAVIAPGRLMPVQSAPLVSHPEGGVVSEIKVRPGQQVAAGDLLVALDVSAIAIELDSVTRQLTELVARQARLEAERAGLDQMPAPAASFKALPDLDVQLRLQGQILSDTRTRLAREVAQADQRTLQVERQIAGLDAQIMAIGAELSIISAELNRLDGLSERGLIEARVVAAEQREYHRKSGELGRLIANRAELKEKLGESRMAAVTTEDRARERAQVELDRVAPQLLRLIGQHSDLILSQKLLEVRAPISGRVYDLQVQGEGFVVREGGPLMTLIPDDNALQAVVQVQVNDIDQVHPQQDTVLRFTAYNARALPLLYGKIDVVAADVTVDRMTRKTYFEVSVEIPQDELENIFDQPIVNGMEVIAFIQTVPQTPLEYVARPVVDYIALAFRDR